MSNTRWQAIARTIRAVVPLSALALPLEFAWEFAQFPLYAEWGENDSATVLGFALHCTAGDVLILAACFTLTAFLYGTPDFHRRPGRPWLLFTLSGAAYTVYSELANVYVRESWGYAPEMPLVPLLHVGLAPLLQWLVLPPLLLAGAAALDRRIERSVRTKRPPDSSTETES